MDKDKKFYEEIEEVNTMVEIVREYGEKILQATGESPDLFDFMTALYEAGYRKADEVRKETAKEIIKLIDAYARYTNKGVSGNYMLIQLNRDDVEGLKSRIKDLCGIEVDK